MSKANVTFNIVVDRGKDEECADHSFATGEDGVDRCLKCGISFADHTRGFGIGGFTTKSKRTRTLEGL